MTLAKTLNAGLRKVPTWPVYIAGVLPSLVYFYWAVSNQLGADPLAALENRLGKWALQLLILTLLVTPVRKWTGVSFLKFRRAFGLLAFVYVCFHLLTWIVLDKQFFWSEILADLYKRPFIIIGMAAFVVLIPLAVTSNALSIRRLGAARWNNVHKLGYAAVILGAIHYLLLVKAWPTEPILYVLAALLLVSTRIRWARLGKLVQLNQ